ncbi:MAG: alpha/beta hydrolase [Clostridia bacterium]|nr:alpha/beta hydrolase [Clostridia bacterium]
MKVDVIELKEFYPVKGGTLKCIAMDNPWASGHENWKRPAVVVVPGGAYQNVSGREGEPVAAEFFAKGFQTFILKYLCSTDGVSYPEQLIELSSAVDYVKKHAEEYLVNPNEIFVIGFSAGGHLTGNLAVDYQNVSQKAGVELDCKPTAIALSYPVISQKTSYQGTHNNLLQGYTEEEKAVLLKTLNLDEAVSNLTPPTFIWTTREDGLVPCENSLLFATALAKNGIAFELHVYPSGSHGKSTGSFEVNDAMPGSSARLSQWIENAIAFFRSYCVEKF